MTYFAEHGVGFSHDAVNRMLRRDKLTPRLVWEHVKSDVITSPKGCLIFDDTIIDKNHSHHIDLVRLQYSGNAHGLIKGIGMVKCLYVNPESGQYWIIDQSTELKPRACMTEKDEALKVRGFWAGIGLGCVVCNSARA